jgi:hypothetical protein
MAVDSIVRSENPIPVIAARKSETFAGMYHPWGFGLDELL